MNPASRGRDIIYEYVASFRPSLVYCQHFTVASRLHALSLQFAGTTYNIFASENSLILPLFWNFPRTNRGLDEYLYSLKVAWLTGPFELSLSVDFRLFLLSFCNRFVILLMDFSTFQLQISP